MVTGKNKEQFEKWLSDEIYCGEYSELTNSKEAYLLPFEMQIGIYLAFYREVHKIVIDVFQESKDGKYTGRWKVDFSELGNYQEEEQPSPEIVNDDFNEAWMDAFKNYDDKVNIIID